MVLYRTVPYFSLSLAFVFDPASPTAGHLYDGLELEENMFCMQIIDTDYFSRSVSAVCTFSPGPLREHYRQASGRYSVRS